MNTLVSVVIPLYNSEKYIRETILSVLNQTYQNIEIVVVDDGSTDSSKSIVDELILRFPKKIKYISQSNQGVSVARNTGIDHATGEFIAFLDSDDYWVDSKIEEQVKALSESQKSVCYSGHINLFNDTGSETENHTEFLSGDISQAFLEHKIVAQTGTWLFNLRLLKEFNIKFTPNANWGEDIEFIFKAISVAEVTNVPKYLTYYRVIHSGNLSSKFRDYIIKTEKELEVYRRIKDWILEHRNKLVSKNPEKLLNIISSYSLPHIVVDNACIYFKSNNRYDKNTLSRIKTDFLLYFKKFQFINGKRSIKLYLKYWYAKVNLKKSKA